MTLLAFFSCGTVPFYILIISWQQVATEARTKSNVNPFYLGPTTSQNYKIIDSKWTNMQQLDRILTSIDEKLEDMSNRQKVERMSNTINDLQIIGHRLQNIEDQMARAESFNRLRLDKIFESIQKEEFMIDQLVHKIDKNQQQVNNRISDIETALEKVSKTQEDLKKDIRKINAVEGDLSSNLDDVTDSIKDIKLLATESFQDLNISQRTFHQHLLNMIANVSNHEQIRDSVKRLEQLAVNSTTSCSQNDAAELSGNTKNDMQKDLHGESLKLIAAIDNMYNDLKQQTQSIESISKESLGITNKIYKKINENEVQDVSDMCDNFVDTAAQEVSNIVHKHAKEIDDKVRNHIEKVVVEQHTFMDNCYRLQLNEDHIENKIVTILETLLQIMDNRTNGVTQQFEDMLKQIQGRENGYNSHVEELHKFVRAQSDYVTRTVAHAANKVIELDKESKHVQNSISSMKDVCYNISTNMQDITKGMNVLTKLVKKEYSTPGYLADSSETCNTQIPQNVSITGASLATKNQNPKGGKHSFSIQNSLKDGSRLTDALKKSKKLAFHSEPGSYKHNSNGSTTHIWEYAKSKEPNLATNPIYMIMNKKYDKQANVSDILLKYLKGNKYAESNPKLVIEDIAKNKAATPSNGNIATNTSGVSTTESIILKFSNELTNIDTKEDTSPLQSEQGSSLENPDERILSFLVSSNITSNEQFAITGEESDYEPPE